MKKETLDITYDIDFDVLGIVSGLKPYKLVWSINNKIGLKFKMVDDYLLDFQNNVSMFFQVYQFENDFINFKLIKNKSFEFSNIAAPFLLPEKKEFDFIMLCDDLIGKYETNELVDLLKDIQGVDFVQEINVSNLKSKDNLIF